MLWSHCRGTCGAQLQGVVHCARVVVLTVCGCMAQNDAAAVLRAGFEVFYPTVDVRHTLLQGLVQAMCDASCDDLVPRPLAVALFDRLGQVRAVATSISLLVGLRTLTHCVCCGGTGHCALRLPHWLDSMPRWQPSCFRAYKTARTMRFELHHPCSSACGLPIYKQRLPRQQ